MAAAEAVWVLPKDCGTLPAYDWMSSNVLKNEPLKQGS